MLISGKKGFLEKEQGAWFLYVITNERLVKDQGSYRGNFREDE
ncbi:hypothetical protein SAMN05216436_1422 [bacterium A37T11]|nr:hypothetical protein SAMN05216436_1422 [bacterium A37T11]